MKTTTTLLSLLLTATYAIAQQTAPEPPACDCPDCREKAAAGSTGFTLSGLEGLNVPGHLQDCDAADHEHEQHDHAEEAHDAHDHADHAEDEHDAHAEHGHTDADVADIHAVKAGEAGIQVCKAEGGTIARTSVFPAEIKLNRDHSAVVSPRYASVVRQVFAEIGDPVKKGDILASLENRETLAVYPVTAPLAGVVIAKNLSVGETADTDKMLYEIADLSSVWADISIFPQYQHLIKKGMEVLFIAHDGHEAGATVKYISPIVSHETRTFTARCVLHNPGDDFTPGAFVRARIATETAEVSVRVEREAVQWIDGEPVVFVPGDHGYEPVPVETGLEDARFIEIRRGVEPGGRYVGAGAFTLKSELLTSGMDPHAGHSH